MPLATGIPAIVVCIGCALIVQARGGLLALAAGAVWAGVALLVGAAHG